MKNCLLIFTAITLLLAAVPGVRSENAKSLYTCGMHPAVIQDHPGNCPICGMKLTPIKAGAEAGAANTAAIAVDAATRQNMNLRTATVQSGPLRKTIRTVGNIDYNETALAEVSTRFRGWVEQLNVDATGQLVHRGEPLFGVSSAELYPPQTEFLQSVTNRFRNFSNVIAQYNQARRNLKLLGFQDAQIAEIETNRQPLAVFKVGAPSDGFVIEKNIVQGQMVEAGARLYRIADLGLVWVIAQIYEPDLPFMKLGQEAIVKVASLPDREFRGRVTFLYPSVDEKTRTAKVRLEFENPGYFLKPGMFVSVQIQAELAADAVLVPESAVLRSGSKNTVFIAEDDGHFLARDVRLGTESEGGFIQVLSGLQPGERVVSSGQFLLDSESQLREAIEKMRGPSRWGEHPREPQRSTNILSTNGAPGCSPHRPEAAETAVYVCPMPEHVSIVYDHAGNCPICGMALVPVTASALQKIQPGGQVLYYTCPMSEHASVHEAKPGKCPLCAMTLIPVMAQPEAKAKPLYSCPMHPEIIADKPGICPKCEMDLVPAKSK